MTNGSSVRPSNLRRWINGTVRRFMGVGVGFARDVEVSSVNVVDMNPVCRLL